MEKEDFVAALNEDLETEYQSIVQYVNHVAQVTGA
jgi:bacterioferritin (cytochrome b1)